MVICMLVGTKERIAVWEDMSARLPTTIPSVNQCVNIAIMLASVSSVELGMDLGSLMIRPHVRSVLLRIVCNARIIGLDKLARFVHKVTL